MAEHYPSHLPLFESYPFPIQRADAIRYFILDHYGGIYLDLDDGCARRLDALLPYPSWLRRTKPTGISNDAMGSVPGHPFFKQVIDALPRYNRYWGMPYITVMFSTGPLFLSVIWEEYMRQALGVGEEVMVLMPEEYSGNEWSFFDISAGSSWHGNDAKTIFWMGRHWLLLTVSGFIAAGVVGLCLWWMWSTWVMRSRRRRSMGWRRVSGVEI
jgi:mannosyltransferase OCH1-like enzyme